MNNQELRKNMMKLWKDTFHDSDKYISLVFDNYFNPDFIEYHEENGKLISALLGIPYNFSNGKEKIKGMYLCGLATLEEYRHRGIMNNLIEKINEKAPQNGCAFSFLIPSSDMLRMYYISKGYFNAMYVVEDRYTNVHNFDKDYRAILNKEDKRIKALKTNYYDNLGVEKISIYDDNLLEKITEFIINSEESVSSYTTLLHSKKDVVATLHENIISGGDILVCKTAEDIITGVMYVTFDERKRIIIPKIYHKDNCSYFKLLDKAKNLYPDSSMSIICYPEETERRVLWSKVYGASNPDGGMLGGAYGVAERVYEVNRHARPYGMVKILDYHEILKFLANDRNDLKYSILVKGIPNEKEALYCVANNGESAFQTVAEEEIKKFAADKNLTILSKRDLSEILFRKKDSNSLIMEALGIPRLSMNMSLLLD